MALVVPGPLVTGARRSVGGVTFRRDRGRDIVQKRPIPPTHTSPAAVLSKTRFKLAMASWSLLAARPYRFDLLVKAAAATMGQSATQSWAAAVVRLQAGALAPWAFPLTYRDGRVLSILATAWTPATGVVTFSVDGLEVEDDVLALAWEQLGPATLDVELVLARVDATGVTLNLGDRRSNWAFVALLPTRAVGNNPTTFGYGDGRYLAWPADEGE